MAFKPNYRMQRADRDRAKREKKEEKLRARQAAAANGEPMPEGSDVDDADDDAGDPAETSAPDADKPAS